MTVCKTCKYAAMCVGSGGLEKMIRGSITELMPPEANAVFSDWVRNIPAECPQATKDLLIHIWKDAYVEGGF